MNETGQDGGRRFRFVAALAGAMALAACSTIPSNLPVAPPNPGPDDGQGVTTEAYRLHVGDVLDIRLFESPELNEEVTVRPDGHISTGIVRDEQATGRTVPELAQALAKDYGEFTRTPHLTVVVKSFSPDRVYVGGEVVQPGEFLTIPPNLTLTQAIARAGGTKLSASTGDVMILRRGPGDVPELFVAHYGNIRNGTDASADVRLANYDVVYVPRTGIAEFYVFFNQYLQQFVPVSWGFSYVFNSNNTSVVQ